MSFSGGFEKIAALGWTDARKLKAAKGLASRTGLSLKTTQKAVDNAINDVRVGGRAMYSSPYYPVVDPISQNSMYAVLRDSGRYGRGPGPRRTASYLQRVLAPIGKRFKGKGSTLERSNKKVRKQNVEILSGLDKNRYLKDALEKSHDIDRYPY